MQLLCYSYCQGERSFDPSNRLEILQRKLGEDMPRTIVKKPVAAKRKAAVSDTTPKRLDRIEEKLEESRLNLARVDEKITTIFNRQGSIESDVKSLTEKIGNGLVEKIFWVVLASALGFLAAHVGGGA